LPHAYGTKFSGAETGYGPAALDGASVEHIRVPSPACVLIGLELRPG